MEFSRGIKAKASQEVNSTRLFAFATGLLWGALLWIQPTLLVADDAPTASTPSEPTASPSPNPSPSVEPPLPDIEARVFDVKVAKRSASTKTYLFDDVAGSEPPLGKILLLRRDSEQIMAFRVVKLYPEKKQFAAKRVRTYGFHRVIEPGSTFSALEKVGDVVIPPPTAQDKADLKELESKPGDIPPPPPDAVPPAPATTPPPTAPGPEVQAFDSDLDAGNSPPPAGAVDSENAKDSPTVPDDDEDDETSHFGMAIEEVVPLDPNSQWLTATFAYFNNGGSYFAGAGMRYGLSLGKMLFLRKPRLQDSIVLEAGLFFYKITTFVSTGDSYSVMPLVGTARYNILFGENFGIFFYGGLVQNVVTSATNGTTAAQTALQTVLPAAGTGLLFRVGPSWESRVDLGYDMLGLGLILRF